MDSKIKIKITYDNKWFLLLKEGKFKLWIVISLGYFFINESINKKIEKRIYDKMEELQKKANKEFEEYLNQNGLESVMGIVVKKGTVKIK